MNRQTVFMVIVDFVIKMARDDDEVRAAGPRRDLCPR